MKAYYKPGQAAVKTLMVALTKINILTYAEFFGVKVRAAHNFVMQIENICQDYYTECDGYAHDFRIAQSLKKQGIDIEPKGLTFPVYLRNYDRIKFYLNLTAKCLLDKKKSKADVLNYIGAYVEKLKERQWTDGTANMELDRLLKEKVDVIVVDRNERAKKALEVGI